MQGTHRFNNCVFLFSGYPFYTLSMSMRNPHLTKEINIKRESLDISKGIEREFPLVVSTTSFSHILSKERPPHSLFTSSLVIKIGSYLKVITASFSHSGTKCTLSGVLLWHDIHSFFECYSLGWKKHRDVSWDIMKQMNRNREYLTHGEFLIGYIYYELSQWTAPFLDRKRGLCPQLYSTISHLNPQEIDCNWWVNKYEYPRIK